MDVIDIATNKMIGWNPAEQNFSVELSDLPTEPINLRRLITDRCWDHKPIIIKNSAETNKEITIYFVKADMDGSHEDTYGWNYKGVAIDSKNRRRHFTFLFIND
jgi:hypothetical protein